MTGRIGLACFLVACGKPAAQKDASDPPPEAPSIDAQLRCPPVPGTHVTARKIADRCTGEMAPCFDFAVTQVASPPGDERLFAIQQDGMIRILQDEQIVAEPFANLTYQNYGPVVEHGEAGLLGIAFHPQFATNRQLFVFYNAINRTGSGPYFDTLSRYVVSEDDPNKLDPMSKVELLKIVDPFSNHNGGMLAFGKDGYLYVATGDGGSGGDPQNHAQNPRSLLGKMLRIDVDTPPAPGATKPYVIPADNPFADGVAAEPEIFMSGLRNPWRWAFDGATGDLWIPDVGQQQREELTVLAAGNQAGKNLGWNMWEGDFCFKAPCSPDGKTFPQHQRPRPSGWQAIIGGVMYRGACYPDLAGWFYFTDHAVHGLSRAKLNGDGTLTVEDLPVTLPVKPTSISADAFGEMYVTTVDGEIYKLEVTP